MSRARRTDLITIIALCVIAIAATWYALFGRSTQKQGAAPSIAHEVTYEDYNGMKIGIATGRSSSTARAMAHSCCR